MNILIIGSGGREHALAWKMAASPLTDKLYCAPGNAGIAQEAECVALDIADHAAVIAFCKEKKIDFVVVGPEVPLCAGIVDDLEGGGIKAFGPTKWAARLEGSKGFTKDLCKANNIPTAAYERFKSAGPAKDYVRKTGAPIVVKADGLAAGKGVVVAETVQEAEAAIDMMFGGGLGAPAWEIVIEECLVGEEASFFALCDGETAIQLASAQDHKRVGDGDKGPNTGGMGAYSPLIDLDDQAVDEIVRSVHEPLLAELVRRGTPFRGFLYAGLMLTAAGPRLLETNVRLGDPEAQVILPRVAVALGPLLRAAARGELPAGVRRIAALPGATVGIVLAAAAYPDEPSRGDVIEGLERAGHDALVFHMGTARGERGWETNGGRILTIVGSGRDVAAARAAAERGAARISWPGMQRRHDIGATLAEAVA
jgi:phosphoribosylamine---glycine ligase